MGAFLRRHRAVHIWLVGLLALFGVYWYGISSREAADAVSAVTQRVKDGYARLWYLFPFSVVEWFYVAFIVGIVVWLAVLLHRVRTWRGRRLESAYVTARGIHSQSQTAIRV